MNTLFWILLIAFYGVFYAAAQLKEKTPRTRSERRERRRASREERLEVLSRRLTNGELGTSPSRVRVRGKRHGREVRFTARRIPDASSTLKFSVGLNSDLYLHATRSLSGGADGYRLSQTFLTEDSERLLRQAAADERVRKHLAALFRRFDCTEVWIGDRWVTARRKDTGFNSTPGNVLKVVDRLEQLARALETLRVAHKVKATARAPENVTCPYCRDTLSPDEELVACASCATVHHGECFRELGRCTSLGCGSGQAVKHEPAPLRPSARVRLRVPGSAPPVEVPQAPEVAVDITPCFYCGESFRGCSEDACRASLRDQRRQARRRALERRRIRGEEWRGVRRRF